MTGVPSDDLMWFPRTEVLLNMVGACTTEDNNIQQRVGTEAIGTVDGDTGSFASSVESRNNLVFAILFRMLE